MVSFESASLKLWMVRTQNPVQQRAAKVEQTISGRCQSKGISEATCYAGRKKFGGMAVREGQCLRELEKENARLIDGIPAWNARAPKEFAIQCEVSSCSWTR